MQHTLTLGATTYPLKILRRRGTKNIRLALNSTGLSVTAPAWYPIFRIKRLLHQQAAWIIEKVQHMPPQPRLRRQDTYLAQKEEARVILTERANYYAARYGFSYNNISVRNQSSRWGSCSREKNLNFNYRAAFLEDDLRDYVIVHEICHLKEMNHSIRFWLLVAREFPHYKVQRRKLRKHSLAL